MPDHEVYLTTEAERDLEEIADYIERHDSRERADYIYQRIKAKILALENLPARGRIVPELKRVGVTDFREIFFKPYRILYYVSAKCVYVHCIFDGRRDVEDVLSERLLR